MKNQLLHTTLSDRKTPAAALSLVLLSFAGLGTATAQDYSYSSVPSQNCKVWQGQVKVLASTKGTYNAAGAVGPGYCGLQHLNDSSDTKAFIFSMWDQTAANSAVIGYNPLVTVRNTTFRFGGEGTGAQLFFNWAWAYNTNYRFAYRAYADPDGVHSRWEGHFYDGSTSKWYYAGTFLMDIDGTQQLIAPGCYCFQENFSGIHGDRQAEFTNQWWLNVSNTWSESLAGTAFNIPPNTTGEDNARVDSIAGGVRFVYNSGVTNPTPENTSFSPTAGASDAPLYVPFRINCGSDTSFATTVDKAFSSDAFCTTSGTYTYDNGATISTTGVTGAAPANVYRSIRGGNDFSYVLSGLKPNTSHTVVIHLCENWYSTAGNRPQDMYVNGTKVATALDVFTAAGGKNKPLVKTYTTSSGSTGTVTLRFVKAGSDYANVAGIEVY